MTLFFLLFMFLFGAAGQGLNLAIYWKERLNLSVFFPLLGEGNRGRDTGWFVYAGGLRRRFALQF